MLRYHLAAELLRIAPLILLFASSVLMAVPSAQAQTAPACGNGPVTSGGTTTGTPCNDEIIAEPGVTAIDGGGGDDTIYATHAVRTVKGGDGNDTIFGEIPVSKENGASAAASAAIPGATFIGGAGDDVIYATFWVIEIDGGDGRDLLYGEVPEELVGKPATSPPPLPPPPSAGLQGDPCPPGSPEVYCGLGNQTFNGSPGNDVVFGQRGNDVLNGDDGDDQLFGGIGDDVVRGNEHADLVSGGMGHDTMDGNNGNDLVRGDATIDNLDESGGLGTDTVSFATGATPGFQGNAASGIPGFPGADEERGVYVNLDPISPDANNGAARFGGGNDSSEFDPTGFENVIGTPFSDYIVGSDGQDRIDGGGGADAIVGRGGNDTIYGGADGDHLDGDGGTNTLVGGGGSDYCVDPTTASCERSASNDPDGGVDIRNTGLISVGYMGIDDLASRRFVDLYLTGSSSSDDIRVVYDVDQGTGNVTFTAQGSTPNFDTSGDAQTYLCTYASREVRCDLPRQLDALVLTGMAGSDDFNPSGDADTNIPETLSMVQLGGEGGDTLLGRGTEEILVDGPDVTGSWADALTGNGGDDALINNGGTDDLSAGNGNDLLLSASVCDNDILAGDNSIDNASWAKMPPLSQGGSKVVADLVDGKAGDLGGPTCSGSQILDSLFGIEDLEGSDHYDGLTGGGGNNQLLGRNGGDGLFGGAGDDRLLAVDNPPFADTDIDCGAGGGDTSSRDGQDPMPVSC